MAAVVKRLAATTLLLLVAPLLQACDPYALQRRQAATAAWVGQSEADLVRGLGVPTRTFEADGRRFLAYTEGSTQIVPPFEPWYPWGYRGYYGGGFPAEVVQRVCETTFEVAGNRVTGFSLRGNACG